MSSSSPLRYLLRTHTPNGDKLCFLCGRCRSDGYRFMSVVDDLPVAVGMPGVEGDAAACLMALQTASFDADTIRRLLLGDDSNDDDNNTVARLFTARRKGVVGGVPTCWRGCALSDQLHQMLRQQRATSHLLHHHQQQEHHRTSTITNAPFSTGYLTYDPARYEDLLQDKVNVVRRRFETRFFPVGLAIEVHPSPPTHFRQRCRLAVARDAPNDGLVYLLWDDEGWPSNRVEQFPVASKVINDLLQPLRVAIEGSAALRDGLQAAHFLSTLENNVVVRLQYAIELNGEAWTAAAETARQHILLLLSRGGAAVPGLRSLSLVGRAKDTKLVAGSDAVEERLLLADGRSVRYLQSIDGFSNPNAAVNVMCLNWLCEVVKEIDRHVRLHQQQQGNNNAVALDILELYCGNGNHTMALAAFARRVVAVELNKALCVAAEANMCLNNINNVTIVACDSESFARKILRSRRYIHATPAATGAAPGNAAPAPVIHDFSAVLVDPPRCGLDPTTRKLVQGYDHVVYISCGQDALERDMEALAATHDVQRFAVYDQFAYSTGHIECGVYLRKKNATPHTSA